MTGARLERLPRDDAGETQYLHPHGWVIVRERRTWSERVGAIRGVYDPMPMVWWSVYLHASSTRDGRDRYRPGVHRGGARATTDTLRDAREWCDEHPREGWAAT